jgi:hypothetical protein
MPSCSNANSLDAIEALEVYEFSATLVEAESFKKSLYICTCCFVHALVHVRMF